MGNENDNEKNETGWQTRWTPIFLIWGIAALGTMASEIFKRPQESQSPRAVETKPTARCNVGRQIGRFQIEKCSPDGNDALVVSEAQPGHRIVDHYRFDTEQLCTIFSDTGRISSPVCTDADNMNEKQRTMFEAARQDVQKSLPAQKPG